MTFQELIRLTTQVQKYPGCATYEPTSLLNEGFPSSFNLSFAHYEWCKIEGITGEKPQYLSFAKDLVFSKVQPCLRHQDFQPILNNAQEQYRYLTYFHMADISACIARMDRNKQSEIGRFAISSLLRFLVDRGLPLSQIFVSYCAGGETAKLTDGKYTFDHVFARDPFYSTWIDEGVPETNMIADQTRDTLLALRNFSRPSPWGYRNEIYFLHQGEKLDIATVEHLMFEPEFDETGEIINVRDYDHAFSISAIGVERLLMVLNNLKTITDIDIIKPLMEMVAAAYPTFTESEKNIFVQSLRSIHAIVADGGTWTSLNKRRKTIARMFYTALADLLVSSSQKLPTDFFVNFFKMNAALLSNPRMNTAIPSTINEIEERFRSFGKNRTIPGTKRLQYRELQRGIDANNGVVKILRKK